VLYLGHLPPQSAQLDPNADIHTYMTISDEVKVMRADETNPEQTELVWIPLTCPGTYVATTEHGGSTTGGYTANAWKGIDQYVMDNRLVLYMYDDNPSSTATDVLQLETVMNIETIFHQEDQYLQAPKVAPGDPSVFAERYQEAIKQMDSQGWSDVLMTGVKTGVEFIAPIFNNRKTQTHAAGMAGSLLASVFSGVDHPAHRLNMRHVTTNSADSTESKRPGTPRASSPSPSERSSGHGYVSVREPPPRR
jgi:hypothetical protein